MNLNSMKLKIQLQILVMMRDVEIVYVCVCVCLRWQVDEELHTYFIFSASIELKHFNYFSIRMNMLI